MFPCSAMDFVIHCELWLTSGLDLVISSCSAERNKKRGTRGAKSRGRGQEMFASTHMMHLDALRVFKCISEIKLKVCVTGNTNDMLRNN